MARMFTVMLLAATMTPEATGPQQAQFPRLAAVRFALENGWKIPRTNVVVVVETHLGSVDGRPVPQSDEQRLAETELIAKLLGPGAKTGVAKDYLSCPVPWVCHASTDAYVLVINGLFQGETDILIKLHTPANRNGGVDSMTQAVVDLDRRGTADWVGVRYSLQPTTLVRHR